MGAGHHPTLKLEASNFGSPLRLSSKSTCHFPLTPFAVWIEEVQLLLVKGQAEFRADFQFSVACRANREIAESAAIDDQERVRA